MPYLISIAARDCAVSLIEHARSPAARYGLGDVRDHANRNEETGHIVEHESGC